MQEVAEPESHSRVDYKDPEEPIYFVEPVVRHADGDFDRCEQHNPDLHLVQRAVRLPVALDVGIELQVK